MDEFFLLLAFDVFIFVVLVRVVLSILVSNFMPLCFAFVVCENIRNVGDKQIRRNSILIWERDSILLTMTTLKVKHMVGYDSLVV